MHFIHIRCSTHNHTQNDEERKNEARRKRFEETPTEMVHAVVGFFFFKINIVVARNIETQVKRPTAICFVFALVFLLLIRMFEILYVHSRSMSVVSIGFSLFLFLLSTYACVCVYVIASQWVWMCSRHCGRLVCWFPFEIEIVDNK